MSRHSVLAIVLLLGSVVYGNSAMSQAAPVGQGERCGPLDNILCTYGSWCDFDAASCESVRPQGVCVAISEDCRRSKARPVCGCDGKEYRSDCDRVRARVQKSKDGPC